MLDKIEKTITEKSEKTMWKTLPKRRKQRQKRRQKLSPPPQKRSNRQNPLKLPQQKRLYTRKKPLLNPVQNNYNTAAQKKDCKTNFTIIEGSESVAKKLFLQSSVFSLILCLF